MGPLTDDRGQALVVGAVVMAIAVIAVVGLRAAQDRMVEGVRAQRAGEAAAEAAAEALADAYVAYLSTVPGGSAEARIADVTGLVADAKTLAAARRAADELARENGGRPIDSVTAVCVGGRIEARLVVGGFQHHAGFAAAECSRP